SFWIFVSARVRSERRSGSPSISRAPCRRMAAPPSMTSSRSSSSSRTSSAPSRVSRRSASSGTSSMTEGSPQAGTRASARALRGGVVGFGFIAERGHLPAYRSLKGGFEIAAVADVCAARREVARQQLPSARIYESAEELLEKERGLDFVDV